MPMIPRGNEQQVLQGRSPIELFDNEAGRALGQALQQLGTTIVKIKKENNRDAVSAAAEEYEYNSRLELDKASSEYKSVDPSAISFEEFIRPRMEKLKESVGSKYGLAGNTLWQAASKKKENELIPSIMLAESKEAITRQKEIEAAQAALRADQIYTSNDPNQKFMEFVAKTEIEVERGIQEGKYIPEQREAIIAQRRQELVNGTIDAYVRREQFKGAISFLDTQRDNYDRDTFNKERDNLLARFRQFEDDRDERRREQERLVEKERKERVEKTEAALLLEREKIGNDTVRMAVWSQKVDAALAGGDLDVGARQRLFKTDTLTGGLTDSRFTGDLYADIVNDRITPTQALERINKAPISAETRADLIRQMNGLLESAKDRNEQFNRRLSEATFNYIESSVRASIRGRLDEKSADKLIDGLKLEAAHRESVRNETLSPAAIQRLIPMAAKRMGINLAPETARSLGAGNMSKEGIERKLRELTAKYKQNRESLTPDQLEAMDTEIRSLHMQLQEKKREEGL